MTVTVRRVVAYEWADVRDVRLGALADDPDAFGEAWDLGLGAIARLGERWRLRAEWMLRRQAMSILRVDPQTGENVVVDEEQILWGRSLRVGFLYEF